MTTIQEYFDTNEPKNREKIFLEGNKLGDVKGDELIIENFNQLESVCISNLPNLIKLTIKDCGKLKSLSLYLDKKIEVILIGDVFLSNIKTSNTNKPTIIYQPKIKEGFCWNCAFHALALISIVILAAVVVYLVNLINHLKELIKALKQKLKIK